MRDNQGAAAFLLSRTYAPHSFSTRNEVMASPPPLPLSLTTGAAFSYTPLLLCILGSLFFLILPLAVHLCRRQRSVRARMEVERRWIATAIPRQNESKHEEGYLTRSPMSNGRSPSPVRCCLGKGTVAPYSPLLDSEGEGVDDSSQSASTSADILADLFDFEQSQTTGDKDEEEKRKELPTPASPPSSDFPANPVSPTPVSPSSPEQEALDRLYTLWHARENTFDPGERSKSVEKRLKRSSPPLARPSPSPSRRLSSLPSISPCSSWESPSPSIAMKTTVQNRIALRSGKRASITAVASPSAVEMTIGGSIAASETESDVSLRAPLRSAIVARVTPSPLGRRGGSHSSLRRRMDNSLSSGSRHVAPPSMVASSDASDSAPNVSIRRPVHMQKNAWRHPVPVKYPSSDALVPLDPLYSPEKVPLPHISSTVTAERRYIVAPPGTKGMKNPSGRTCCSTLTYPLLLLADDAETRRFIPRLFKDGGLRLYLAFSKSLFYSLLLLRIDESRFTTATAVATTDLLYSLISLPVIAICASASQCADHVLFRNFEAAGQCWQVATALALIWTIPTNLAIARTISQILFNLSAPSAASVVSNYAWTRCAGSVIECAFSKPLEGALTTAGRREMASFGHLLRGAGYVAAAIFCKDLDNLGWTISGTDASAWILVLVISWRGRWFDTFRWRWNDCGLLQWEVTEQILRSVPTHLYRKLASYHAMPVALLAILGLMGGEVAGGAWIGLTLIWVVLMGWVDSVALVGEARLVHHLNHGNSAMAKWAAHKILTVGLCTCILLVGTLLLSAGSLVKLIYKDTQPGPEVMVAVPTMGILYLCAAIARLNQSLLDAQGRRFCVLVTQLMGRWITGVAVCMTLSYITPPYNVESLLANILLGIIVGYAVEAWVLWYLVLLTQWRTACERVMLETHDVYSGMKDRLPWSDYDRTFGLHKRQNWTTGDEYCDDYSEGWSSDDDTIATGSRSGRSTTTSGSREKVLEYLRQRNQNEKLLSGHNLMISLGEPSVHECKSTKDLDEIDRFQHSSDGVEMTSPLVSPDITNYLDGPDDESKLDYLIQKHLEEESHHSEGEQNKISISEDDQSENDLLDVSAHMDNDGSKNIPNNERHTNEIERQASEEMKRNLERYQGSQTSNTAQWVEDYPSVPFLAENDKNIASTVSSGKDLISTQQLTHKLSNDNYLPRPNDLDNNLLSMSPDPNMIDSCLFPNKEKQENSPVLHKPKHTKNNSEISATDDDYILGIGNITQIPIKEFKMGHRANRRMRQDKLQESESENDDWALARQIHNTSTKMTCASVVNNQVEDGVLDTFSPLPSITTRTLPANTSAKSENYSVALILNPEENDLSSTLYDDSDSQTDYSSSENSYTLTQDFNTDKEGSSLLYTNTKDGILPITGLVKVPQQQPTVVTPPKHQGIQYGTLQAQPIIQGNASLLSEDSEGSSDSATKITVGNMDYDGFYYQK
uniref:Uncharacterized protein n=1 Tax=Corethron hystrix TaxID=216773 RepID=A0A7S1FXJ9_9STRA|mmetsp:Transcript_39887/g.93631  ORF Transcript_39887/g.93631 Transcript_39887/m.93631 type:complete len:1465 (+) Transcript_39887:101-4495(+)